MGKDMLGSQTSGPEMVMLVLYAQKGTKEEPVMVSPSR